MGIMGKAATTLIKSANDGNIALVDSMVDKAAQIDFSKFKSSDVSNEDKKKANDYKKIKDEVLKVKQDMDEVDKQLKEQINLYESLLLAADEVSIKVSLENDDNPFLPNTAYTTSNDIFNIFNIEKKKFNNFKKDIIDYKIIDKEFKNIIKQVKLSETKLLGLNKKLKLLRDKKNRLNSSIEKLKK